jgi:threonine dehydrogenase-like Zn-dependent dehydrogenase
MHMKAFAVLEPGKTGFVDIPVPEPDDYEALVKIEACAICNRTDWMVINQGFGAKGYPVILGHESFGKVITVGKKVQNMKVGDRVTGANAIPKKYDGNYYSAWGGFAEYGIAGDYKAFQKDKGKPSGDESYRSRYVQNIVIPADFSLEMAGLAIPLSETASCIMQLDSIKNMNVIVMGTGIAGLSLVMFAKLFGAKQVFCVGRREERLQLAKELGADRVYLAHDSNMPMDVADRMIDDCGRHGADVVLEATGNHDVFQKGISFLAEEGVIAIYGVPEKPYVIDTYHSPRRFRVETVSPDEVMAMDYVCALLKNNKTLGKILLTNLWHFNELPEALEQVRAGHVVKGIVVMS